MYQFPNHEGKSVVNPSWLRSIDEVPQPFIAELAVQQAANQAVELVTAPLVLGYSDLFLLPSEIIEVIPGPFLATDEKPG